MKKHLLPPFSLLCLCLQATILFAKDILPNRYPVQTDTFFPCNGIDGINATLPANVFASTFTNCPGYILNNPVWYAFRVETTSLTIQVTASNCTTASGLQGGLYKHSGQPLDLQCPCAETSFTLNSTNINPGSVCYLLIDGCNGDECDYSIDVLAGIVSGIYQGYAAIQGPATTCSGSTSYFTLSLSNESQSLNHWLKPDHAQFLSDSSADQLILKWEDGWVGRDTVCAVYQDSCLNQEIKVLHSIEVGDYNIPGFSGPDQVCRAQNATYSLQGSLCPTQHWYWTATGGSVIGADDAAQVEVNWQVAGTAMICLNQIKSSGDTLVLCHEVAVDSAYWAGIFKVGDSTPLATNSILPICLGDTLSLKAGLLGSASNTAIDSNMQFVWTLDGNIVHTGRDISLNFPEASCHNLMLSAANAAICPMSTLEIRAVKTPLASIINTLPTGSCPGQVFDLIAVANTSVVPCNTGAFSLIQQQHPIQDDGSVLQIPLVVSGIQSSILSANELRSVYLNIEHSYMSDLEIELFCPNGQRALLQNHTGVFGGNTSLGEPIVMDDGFPIPGVGYDYWLGVDTAQKTLLDYTLAFHPPILPSGGYRSFESLSKFEGCPANGTWTLSISDKMSIDNGHIFKWGIIFEDGPKVSTTVEWLPDADIISHNQEIIQVAPEQSKSFTLKVSDNYGCELKQEVPVEVLSGAVCAPCDSLQVSIADYLVLTCKDSAIQATAYTSLTGDFMSYSWRRFPDFGIISDSLQLTIKDVGNYTFSAHNNITGCSASDTLLAVGNVLAPTAIAGQDYTLTCAYPTATLDGSGSSSGPDFTVRWIGPGIDTSGTYTLVVGSAGEYMIVVRDTSNGCESSDLAFVTEDLSLSIFPTYSKPDTCDAMNGIAGILLTVGFPPYEVLWSNGATTAQINGLSAGVYEAVVSLGACERTYSVTVDSIPCSSLSEPDLLQHLVLWPNPNDGRFTLQFNLASAARFAVDLFDMQGRNLGRLIGEQDFSAGPQVMPLNLVRLPSGMYHLWLRGAGVNQAVKLFRL